MSLTKIIMTGTKDLIKAGFDKVNDLIDDLLSTSNGLGASQIGIEDAAGNLDAVNLEAAIAEVYSDTESTRTLSEVFNEDSNTTTGLTWGYKAGVIRVDNIVTDIAAGTVGLTDDDTNYIEISSTGVVSRNTTGFTSGKIPIRTVVCAGGVQTTNTDRRAWFQTETYSTSTVSQGGTGLTTITDHGLLLGSGTDAITPLAAATDGQLPIGSTGADPVLAALTGTANQITITNAAGSITISIPDSPTLTTPTLTSPVLNTAISGTAFLDEDDMASDSATKISSQQAIKAFGVAMSLLSVPSGEKVLFYKNTAVTGYSLLDTLDDKVVYVTKGSAAGGQTGGGVHSAGTWTISGLAHTHTGPSHTHTGPSHTHGIPALTLANSGTTANLTISAIVYAVSGALYTASAGGTTYDKVTTSTGAGTSGAGGTGATGAEGTGATGSGGGSDGTWRPAAYCFTMQQRT